MSNFNCISIIDIINLLQNFWKNHGCNIILPLNLQIGAATSHYMTALFLLKNKYLKIAYHQFCKRPNDSRLLINKNRLQQYLQFQVIMKPIPYNIQKLFSKSLKILGINLLINDLKFIEDNWENPTLGAWGVGWEIWLNGLEIAQFTYFQQMCGLKCNSSVEITYGIERLALILQKKNNIYELIFDKSINNIYLYKHLFLLQEIEFSKYYLNIRNISHITLLYNEYIKEACYLLELKKKIIFPTFENILKAINCFNILDANKIFSNSERQRHILKIKKIVKLIAIYYLNSKI